MTQLTVRLLSEGFLHPAGSLEHELIDANGLFHLPVRDLGTEFQVFQCRVEDPLAATSLEYVVTDFGSPADAALVQGLLSNRFPGAATLVLRSQDTGRAVIDCPPDAPLERSAAAAIAAILHSAAGDDSERMSIEGGGARHLLAVSSDGCAH